MRSRKSLAVRAIVVLGLVVAAQAAVAVQPNPTNRIHMTSKPAVVQVACGWIAKWSWDNQNVQRGMVGSGTGFFIHPDGYVLTNAHVVSDMKISDDDLKAQALVDILGQWLEANNYEVNEGNLRTLAGKIDSGQVSQPQLLDFRRINFVFLQSGKPYPFEIKAYGAPMGEGSDALTGKDVAVLKIEIKNAPTLKLGNSEDVQVGDHVWIMGYPAAAESEYLDQRSALEPTTNDGSISAKKTSRDGTPILQTNTATTHGNSGGPVINEKGEVIGQLTFRGETVGGQEVQGFNFIVPINTAMEFVRQAGTENKPGPVDEKWRKGLEEYWSEYYSQAKDTFRDAVGLFPEHSEAQKLEAECLEKIAQGKDKTPPPAPPPESPATGTTAGTTGTGATGTVGATPVAGETGPKKGPDTAKAGEEEGFPTWAIAAIAGGGGLLVLVVILVIVLSGKKRPAAVPPPGMQPAPYGAPGGAPPPGYGAPPMGAPMGAPMGGPMPAPAPVPGPMPVGIAPTLSAPAPSPGGMVAKTEMYQAPSTTARLSCTVGPLQGRDLPIGNGFFIGRDPARAQVLVQDGQVSAQHMWIGPAGGRIVVRDMGSTNGTYLNNRLDQRIAEMALNEGDLLMLGQRGTVQFVFHT